MFGIEASNKQRFIYSKPIRVYFECTTASDLACKECRAGAVPNRRRTTLSPREVPVMSAFCRVVIPGTYERAPVAHIGRQADFSSVGRPNRLGAGGCARRTAAPWQAPPQPPRRPADGPPYRSRIGTKRDPNRRLACPNLDRVEQRTGQADGRENASVSRQRRHSRQTICSSLLSPLNQVRILNSPRKDLGGAGSERLHDLC